MAPLLKIDGSSMCYSPYCYQRSFVVIPPLTAQISADIVQHLVPKALEYVLHDYNNYYSIYNIGQVCSLHVRRNN